MTDDFWKSLHNRLIKIKKIIDFPEQDGIKICKIEILVFLEHNKMSKFCHFLPDYLLFVKSGKFLEKRDNAV